MQSMQRSFGRLMSKGPGDNAKVSVMLSDYEDADKVLAKIIDSAKSWRDAWVSLANTQLGVATEYEGLYDPIVGATDGHGKDMAPTPEVQLARTLRLCAVYRELKDELIEEITQIETRVIKPATDARDCILPIRKTIKKRENKRLDYEKAQEKVNKLGRKTGGSGKEEAALAKAQIEMQTLAEEFHNADTHLRETLPPIVNAAFSMIPSLLGCHVLVQNKLLGLYYTFLHNYCEEVGFPSPPPPMEQVVADFNATYRPVVTEIESIGCVARGKVLHQTLRVGPEDVNGGGGGQVRKLSAPSLNANGYDGVRRTSTGLIPSTQPANGSGGRLTRIPSMPSPAAPASLDSSQPSPAGLGAYRASLRATDFTTATALGQEAGSAPQVVRPTRPQQLQSDYFSSGGGGGGGYERRVSNGSPAGGTPTTPGAGGGVATPFAAAAAAGKKKPPPPPPPKRIPSSRPQPPPEEFVVALYAFPGQGRGDLSFGVGDRIKIVKKTDRLEDWWEGEIGGVRGSFPANYCQAP